MLKPSVQCNTSIKAKSDYIDSEKIDDLYNWLEDIKLSRPKKNLARDFSDGLLMAELLKQYFPRHVDLNNYRPANSFGNKMKNWLWLNDKVFASLGIAQNVNVLKSIASINLRELEKLLIVVKEKVDEHEDMRIKSHRDQLIMEHEMNTPVPHEQYTALNNELKQKNEELSILSAKVEHLKAMLELKDQRIEDLSILIKKCTCQDKI